MEKHTPSDRHRTSPPSPEHTPSTEELLHEIGEAQSLYISGAGARDVFERLIHILIRLTGSSSGFLDRVTHDESAADSSETLVHAGLIWNDPILPLVTHANTTRTIPGNSSRFSPAVTTVPSGVPTPPHAGEPALLLPLVFGGELGGIAGLAGRPGGYDVAIAGILEPFTATCAAIMRAVRRDRQEQIHAEETRRQEETLRALIGNVPGAVYRSEIRSPWAMEVMTGEIQNITGYPASMFLQKQGMSYADIVHPDDLPMVERSVEEGVQAHHPYQLEYRVIHADGSLRWVFERGCAYYDLTGTPVWLDGVVIDITERRLALEALRESEEKVRGILRAAPTGIGVTVGRVFRDVNTRLCEMTGYTRDELIGSSARVLYDSEAEFERVGTVKYALIAAHGTGSIETRWRRKDGTMMDVLLGSTPVYPGDKSKGIAFTALDITERKTADAVIQASLREKEVLLKEIHHRVKNNLQIISSLLSLQMSGITDGSVRELFRESQNRVRSMALVHERLYRSVTLAEVDFGEYTRAVTSHLLTSYGRPGIACAVDVRDLRLGIDLAIPCGLILNEIVSNALRHAFTGRDRGTIRVAMERASQGEVSLLIDDDGIGHPLGVSWATASSMGTMLISSLTAQVGGTVDMTVHNGTHFRIQIPPGG